jgi:hypothetical protein
MLRAYSMEPVNAAATPADLHLARMVSIADTTFTSTDQRQEPQERKIRGSTIMSASISE